MAITEGTQPAAIHTTAAWTTAQTTASFTPESGALLVALVSGDGTGASLTTATVSDSVNGTTGWVLLRRQNAQDGNLGGTAEVWIKNSPGVAMTVSCTGNAAALGGLNFVVRTLIGAEPVANQNGAVNSTSFTLGGEGVLAISLAGGTGNMVYGAGFNWTNTLMSVNGVTADLDSFLDNTNGDSWQTFKSSSATSGTATYGYTDTVIGQIAAAVIIAAASGTDSGPNYAGTATDRADGTGSWTNPTNAQGAANAGYAVWTAP